MSWRDQLRKASFRGAEFLYLEQGGEFGRRSVTHEYPLRDRPYVEDLGRKARSISIEAFVLATAANGFNYIPGRDALIAAVEQSGSGVLMHPSLGELRVSVTDCRLTEKSAEGGMARFTLSFVESGEVTFPSASANTPSIVNSRADAAEAAVLRDFADRFSVDAQPAFVSEAATELLDDATAAIGGLPRLVPIDKDALASFEPSLAAISSNLPALILDPARLGGLLLAQVDALRGLVPDPVGLLGEAVRDPLNEMKMLRKLFEFGGVGSPTALPAVPLTTPSRAQQARNQEAIADIVRRAAVIAAARAASEKDFTVFQDAAAVRTELSERIETLLLATTNDAAFNALVGLRAAMVNDLTARGADLARLVIYTPAGTVPALALAYDLYADAGRDGEIVARNRVPHPGFIVGGRALKLLADA